jgi:pimeloyl-ACP methyl ester carboxylesterase
VIAVEQMGHGRTADAVDREFHYHDMAEDTVALMDQLQINSAFVFGLSDAGMLGLDMAMPHPERVRKLAVRLELPHRRLHRRRLELVGDCQA